MKGALSLPFARRRAPSRRERPGLFVFPRGLHTPLCALFSHAAAHAHRALYLRISNHHHFIHHPSPRQGQVGGEEEEELPSSLSSSSVCPSSIRFFFGFLPSSSEEEEEGECFSNNERQMSPPGRESRVVAPKHLSLLRTRNDVSADISIKRQQAVGAVFVCSHWDQLLGGAAGRPPPIAPLPERREEAGRGSPSPRFFVCGFLRSFLPAVLSRREVARSSIPYIHVRTIHPFCFSGHESHSFFFPDASSPSFLEHRREGR